MPDGLPLHQMILQVHAHLNCGRLEEAEIVCRDILARDPVQVETLVNLSIVLLRQDKLDEAAAAAGRAIELRPAAAEAHNAMGNIRVGMGRFDQALQPYERAISLRPGRASFHSNRGSALQFVGQLDEAIAEFEKAIALQPGLATAEANRLFAMHFHPGYGPERIRQELRHWAERVEAQLPGEPAPHANDRSRDRQLRIGYVSPHLRDHCLGRLMLPIVREHDRESFALFFYSDAIGSDWMTEAFRAISDGWRDTAGISHEALAEQVRSDRIDILIDLTLHMSGSRLAAFARKPAPVQVTYGGYPSSTGLRAMDYRLTDPYLDPPGEYDGCNVEESVRLPDCFWCYAPPPPHPAVSPLPSDQAGFVTFGCLNNFIKINDGVLRLWARVLGSVKNSRLLLLAPEGSARRQSLQSLQSQGVASHRIDFIAHQPREAYLQTYDRIDIGLDTSPYNGHTTSLDAFWMGVPVVTLVGRSAVGRAGWSQLTNLQLTELAAHDEAGFVAIARKLPDDRDRLRMLRFELRQRMLQSPLTNPRRFTDNLEMAYRQMWRRWCAN